ncbi:MAG: mechanosensitive ion channel family protein [Sandaracinaceae bacterium]
MNLEELTELGVRYGTNVVGVLVALAIAWIVAGWVRRMIRRGLERASFDPTLTRFFANLARWAIIVFAVLGCLGVFGIQTASFAAVVAAAGLAIGLAFQGTLSNFAAGVMLLVFRPFKVADVVEAASVVGVVEEIELFTTAVRTFDNRRLIIPNSAIYGATIENKTFYPTRRVDVPVGVEYSADIDRTREVLTQAVGTVDNLLEDPPFQVFLSGLGASSVDWVVRVWCKTEDYWVVHEAMTRAIKMALDDASIGIPFPQMDVHLDQVSAV